MIIILKFVGKILQLSAAAAKLCTVSGTETSELANGSQ